MASRFGCGLLAGAAGTVALDTTTYADMALRGRAPSTMTRTLVQKLSGLVGLTELGSAEPSDEIRNKQEAIGALLGYATGLSVGIVYGIVRPACRAIPVPLAGLIAGAAAMAMTDGLAVKLGATDLADWDAAAWLSDAIPHAVFGLTVALTYAALDDA